MACNEKTKANSRQATIASSFQILDAVQGEGKKYEVEGKVVRRGKSIAFCEGEVRCEGRVIAKGTLTKKINSPAMHAKAIDKSKL